VVGGVDAQPAAVIQAGAGSSTVAVTPSPRWFDQ
jgi:hypothetical protein